MEAAEPPSSKGLLAGAGRSALLLPPEALPLDGFTVEHDPLYVRVLILDSDGGRVALAVIDQISLSPQLLADIRAILAETAGTTTEWTLACASHTFGAPHIHAPIAAAKDTERANTVAYEALISALHTAANAAQEQLRPARMGANAGASNANVNRDVSTSEGWWLGADEAGPVDRSVTVVRFEDRDGQPIALLVNYAMQSSVTHESVGSDGGRMVSADVAGAAMRHVERLYRDELVALFLVGAAGDQAPYLTSRRLMLDRARRGEVADAHEAGFLLVELLGERLGEQVMQVSEAADCADHSPQLDLVETRVALPGQMPPANFRALRPTTDYDFRPAADSEATLVALRIGDVGFVGVEVELSCSTGMGIKQASPFTHTLVTTMVNGGDKYMVDASGYDRITYGAMNSRYGRGAAERFAARIEAVLQELHNAERRVAASSASLMQA